MASPFFVNAANVITFAIMVFASPISAIVGNRFNLKWVLVFGTLGYAPYSAALYCNSVYGTQWFLLFGAVTCGFSVWMHYQKFVCSINSEARLRLFGRLKRP